MKNLKRLLLSLSFISWSYAASTEIVYEFAKSWKEEFEELAQYYTNPEIETVQDVKEELLVDPYISKKIHHADQIMPIYKLIDCCPKDDKFKKFLLDIQDVQVTFDYLKQKMQIPQDVEVWYVFDQNLLKDAFMSYMIFDRIVYVSERSLDTCPAYRLFTVIHELTHTQQHKHSGLLRHHLDMKDEQLHAQTEREADTNAVQAIACPMCFQAILACQLLQEQSASSAELTSVKAHGYLMSNDLKECLKQKSRTDLCKVHELIENPDVCLELNTPENLKKILQRDFELGSMLDRLSSVKFNTY